MDRGTLLGFCQSLADAVLDGRLEEAAAQYSYPVVIYHLDKVIIEQDRRDAIRALTQVMTKAKAHGTASIKVSIGTVDDSKTGRVSFPLEWAFLGPDGKVMDRKKMLYYCRADADGAPKIAMLEMERHAFEGPPHTWLKGHIDSTH